MSDDDIDWLFWIVGSVMIELVFVILYMHKVYKYLPPEIYGNGIATKAKIKDKEVIDAGFGPKWINFCVNYVAMDRDNKISEDEEAKLIPTTTTYYKCNCLIKVLPEQYEQYKEYDINSMIDIKYLPWLRLFPEKDLNQEIPKESKYCLCCSNYCNIQSTLILGGIALIIGPGVILNNYIGIPIAIGYGIVGFILWEIGWRSLIRCKCCMKCFTHGKTNEVIITESEYQSIMNEFNTANAAGTDSKTLEINLDNDHDMKQDMMIENEEDEITAKGDSLIDSEKNDNDQDDVEDNRLINNDIELGTK